MNVRPDQLKSVLKKQLYPVYLVSGDEPLQAMETTDLIRSSCREQGYAEREIFEVDASFEWQDFNDEAASMSLFASLPVSLASRVVRLSSNIWKIRLKTPWC